MRAFSSSPNSLSSPPASLGSNPASPSNLNLNLGRANIDMDEIVVDTAGGPRFGVMAPPQPPPPDVPLTAAGLPRKKPGRKPGSTVKPKEPKLNPDGTPIVETPKVRRPRKPRDPNAPPVQRKRKAVTQDPDADQAATTSTPRDESATPGQQQQPKAPELASSTRMDIDSPVPLAAASSNTQPSPAPANPDKVVKREGIMSLLNDDAPPPPVPAAPVRMAFDPVRSSSSYDPVRETMVTRDPYGTAGLSSPRAPSHVPNRASASPSISSLVDPPPVTQTVVSPTSGHASFTSQTRFQEASSLPASPSQSARKEPPSLSSLAPKAPAAETKKAVPPLMPQPPKASDTPKLSSMAPPTTVPAPSKKVAAVQAQTRKEKKTVSSSSSPKMTSLKNALPDVPPIPSNTSSDRSILDFGKAAPGEELEAPSIVINIPLNGESNKYINFMRLAEETYGWDALHPRQAADRERKARIAAASAALEKQQSRGDNATGEEEDPASDDADSDDNENADDSNVEMGGMGTGNNAALTSGAEGGPATQDPEKPKRKRRNWREDEYDKMDGFVDDTDMLWEEQAAAVKDGFFVYSGPLVPEVLKPAATDGPAKRGRGGRGRGGGPGSRGGRGGGEGGRGRGGGPGSRGGTTTRKPRITKLEKQRMETEKAERESMAKAVSSTPASTTTTASNASSYGLLLPAGVPSLSAGIGPTGVLAGQ
ncbi:HIR complex subunit [Gnomoniopsis smithogilvyi]|uniref:HIR complex subunit n=1 Tax=Gnomoniopsis smithogilvyi TaxID=1191159 RepID=A0A9W8YMB3_9PEZI|nr:HIR complex subunit [Gnomoniopsis smithogilvyi]